MGLINQDPYLFDFTNTAFTNTYIHVSWLDINRVSGYLINYRYAMYLTYEDRLAGKQPIVTFTDTMIVETYADPFILIYTKIKTELPNCIDN